MSNLSAVGKRLYFPGISLVLLAVLAVGLAAGRMIEAKHQAYQAQAASQRDQKILQVIIRRNPQASIREFLDFPEKFTMTAAALQLDFRYAMALIDVESEWRADAVSPKGAIGLMQLMPATAKAVVDKMRWEGYEAPRYSAGKLVSLGSLGDPEWNIRIGMQFLRWQIDEYGLGPEHLRAYNRGGAQARAHWPHDQYAERVGIRTVALVNEIK
jgi:soluble lytic murein transglycosylase